MLSLGATLNSSYTKGDGAFRASKTMSISCVGLMNSFQLLGINACRGAFGSTSQACAIIYLSASWLLCKSNVPRPKESCCMLQELTQARTAKDTCRAVDFNPPSPQLRSISRRTGRKLKIAIYYQQISILFCIAMTHKGTYQGLSLQKRCFSIKNKDRSNSEKQ